MTSSHPQSFPRGSGILLHITSLPGPFGIGDLGPSAYAFADFLHAGGQKYWQLLPLTPTRLEDGNSPYSSPSAFAGNVLLISPELLVQDNLLDESELQHNYTFSDEEVEFEEAIHFKKQVLEQAWQRFRQQERPQEYHQFCQEQRHWLEDFALYSALHMHFSDREWVEWPQELRNRQPQALRQAEADLAETIEREKFLQWLFFSQWQRLQDYCHRQQVQLIGDIPFYVNHDSADCWVHTNYFKLDAQKQPTAVSGVPPDYFSENGQLWGTPVYDWQELQKDGFDWWVARVRQNLALFDVVRLDHFRAFSAYWEVLAGEETAINGHWVKTPGNEFLSTLRQHFPQMPFIAEDLGELDEPVHELRKRFHLPGMRLLLFAFGEDMPESPYIPHHHEENSIAYTGTHDNNTVLGWYRNETSAADRQRLRSYAGMDVTEANVAEVMQRLVLMSVARLAILPMQDILGLGQEAVMNRPGTGTGNWKWRLKPGLLTNKLAKRLKELNEVYGR